MRVGAGRAVLVGLLLHVGWPQRSVADSVCVFDCDRSGELSSEELARARAALFDPQVTADCGDRPVQSEPRVAELVEAVATAVLEQPLCGAGARSRWVRLPPLASGPRQEVGVAALRGEIFVVGGITPTGVGVTLVEAFDPEANRWRRVVDLPRPVHHVAVASDNAALYVVGGFAAPGFRPVADVYRYDPDANLWQTLPPLPRALGAAAAAICSARLHVVGGSSGSGSVADHFVYDLVRGEWSSAAALPVAVNHLAAVAWEGTLYVVGGRRDGSGLQNHAGFYRYDAEQDQWLPEPPLPTARSGHAAAVLGNWLAVFGGEVALVHPPELVYPHVEVYDFLSGRWLSDLPMPVPRHGFGAAELGGRLYLPGGATRAGLGETAWADAWEVEAESFAQVTVD